MPPAMEEAEIICLFQCHRWEVREEYFCKGWVIMLLFSDRLEAWEPNEAQQGQE